MKQASIGVLANYYKAGVYQSIILASETAGWIAWHICLSQEDMKGNGKICLGYFISWLHNTTRNRRWTRDRGEMIFFFLSGPIIVGWMNVMRGSGRAFTMQRIHDETLFSSKQASV
jgi:hypothetical protein